MMQMRVLRRGGGCLQGILQLRARGRHDYRKKLHQAFCKSDSLSEKQFHNYVNTQLFCANFFFKSLPLIAQEAPLL